ncbi:RND transporter [Thermus composti]|uniref:Efflux RND transporter periplasmic adaptor subunit n=1 Tax=Thermus composti TaxID=532059 RepID=A0ABV6PYP3_9DEIN|nr:efflux RND transporter periplasmic adaptor subunit [Thermus composti]GGM93179.1 RND transporter [Thermus composti]
MARRIALFLLVLAVGVLLGRLSLPSSGEGGAALGTQREATRSPIAGQAAPGRESGPFPSVRLQVQLARAEAGTLTASRQAAGTVVPYLQVNVPAQVGGVVARVLKAPGDRVAQGEAVVQLDPTNLEIALRNAQAALKSAEINLAAQTRSIQEARARLRAQLAQAEAAYQAAQKAYEAAKRVHALGGLSDAELAQAQANLAQAEANLEAQKAALAQNERAGEETLAALRVAVEQAQNQVAQAELNLKNATLRAPFAGEVLSVAAAPGGYLAPGATAFTLAQGRRVQFGVPPEEAALLPVGTPVAFSYGGRTYRARVDQNPGGAVSGSVSLTARLEASPEEPLPLGAAGTVVYTVTLARGVLVPVTALQSDGAELFVYAVEEGVARRKGVRLLAQAQDQAAVEGLSPGAQVVVNPPPGLLEGTPVTGGQGR